MNDTQKNIITFIKQFQRDNGYSPSIAEIAKYSGLTVGGVKYILMSLRNQGVVDWQDGKSRTLKITEAKK